jgi:MoaA/NifB/PqqE/SkfB family radical SAM enzyme
MIYLSATDTKVNIKYIRKNTTTYKGAHSAVGKKHKTPVTGLHNFFTWLAINLRIFFLVIKTVRSIEKAIEYYRQIIDVRENVWNGNMKKIYRVGHKYFYNQYTPAWPSKQYDEMIVRETRRRIFNETNHSCSFVFFAITRKCPLRCEHCFEWDNLNKKETFTSRELNLIVDHYKKQGMFQMHLSGGEPMLRVREMVELINTHGNEVDFWVLTSGFNCTRENLSQLKNAGLKGIVVSIDHYIPEMHDTFRRKAGSFEAAVKAVKYAQELQLATAISICVTKTFLAEEHLWPYAEFAKELGVEFVQLLEPRNIGHYKDHDVLLDEIHIQALEDFFKRINHSKETSHYPTFSYHGFHQRRIGCFAGSRSIYIDSAGNVHSCPFCHTAAYNIKSFIHDNKLAKVPQKPNECPRFGTVV